LISLQIKKLYKSYQQWSNAHREELRAYLVNEEPVSANQNPLKPENPVVSEIEPEQDIFIKFTIVENGIKIESSLGESNELDNARFTKLVYQVTDGKQNSNIVKHLSITGISQDRINQVVDLWQRLKIVENQLQKNEELKNKVVVRASQVLPNGSKD